MRNLKRSGRKCVTISAMLIMIFCVLVLGCSSKENQAENGKSGAKKAPEKVHLAMGTGSSAGTYYYLGAGFANLVNKYYPEIQITAQSTAAAFENARLVATGEMDLGLTCGGTLKYLEEKEKLDLSNVALISVGHRSDAHWLTLANSGINQLSDLKGKRVGVGPQGSATLRLYSITTLDAGFGLKPDTDYTPVYYSFGEIVRGLKEGTIDAGLIAAGFPIATVLDLCTTHKVRFLEISDPILKKLISSKPYFMPITIPAGTYNRQDHDIKSYTIRQRLICRKDLPEEVVYKIVKAVYDHDTERNQIHPQAALWTLENALAGAESDGVDIHPGAIRYFKEKGIYKK